MSATDIICTSCHAWPVVPGSAICERCWADIDDDMEPPAGPVSAAHAPERPAERQNGATNGVRPVAGESGEERRHSPKSARSGAGRLGGKTSLFSPPPWPELDPLALHGLAGDVVRTIEPQTEADPAHLLISFLTAFGAALGRGPHAMAGSAQHPARLFSVVVGATAKARKGTSWATISRVLESAEPRFFPDRVLGGWGSGEAVVDEVRDPRTGEDEGARDKRLLIQEGEFARFLRVASRDGSTLSMTARDAWDGVKLQARSRQSVTVATDHHVTLLGHITLEELRARLTEVEMASGFGNRFLYVLGRQSKLLPRGGNLDDQDVAILGAKVARALQDAASIGRLRRDAPAEDRWAELYQAMYEDDPGGILGAITSRDQAQCLRLSVVYALLDGSRMIGLPHIEAAWALWRYCRDSVAYIFGDNLGDDKADRLLVALRAAGPDGLDVAAQQAVFSNHISQKRLDAARQLLEKRGLARTKKERTGGRPRTITWAVTAESPW